MPLKREENIRRRTGEQFDSTGLRSKNAGPLQPLMIRIYERDRAILDKHFYDRGLKLSQGIRMIIKDYIEREGL